MTSKVLNVLLNINSLTRLREALRKVRNRLIDRTDYAALDCALASRAEDFEVWAGGVSAQALEAAKDFVRTHAVNTEARLEDAPIPLGGAAHLELLFFL